MAKTTRKKLPAITADAETTEVVPVKRGSPAVNIERLLTAAVTRGTLEVVDKLLAVRRELKAEWAREQYFVALSAFQAECPIIKRTKIVPNNDGTVRYRYAPLESIIEQVGPLLVQHGFSWTAKTVQTETSVTTTTEAHHRDGHMEVTGIIMPIDPPPKANKSQGTGSAFTYGRRATFCGAFGIMTEEDDDDGAGSGRPPSNTSPEPPRVSERVVTPTAPPKSDPPPKAEQPAQPTLPKELTGIRPVGAACYWMLVKALKEAWVTLAYCRTQKIRMAKNRGNQQFLEAIQVEVEAEIAKGKKTKEAAA